MGWGLDSGAEGAESVVHVAAHVEVVARKLGTGLAGGG